MEGETGGILHLHAFHVLQTLSPHTAELDTGVPTRGCTGRRTAARLGPRPAAGPGHLAVLPGSPAR
ncbi:hypothetical protein ACFV2Q_04265 [Streptomyces sp. NPDC059650]|uniref:hypothetical protein n=1 Tax=Streptomyces sp. NPDC059650 TaxID=3346896 RepID=UPI0036AB99F0